MEVIHKGRKYTVYSRVRVPKVLSRSTYRGYIYFIQIGESANRKYKIGTTNDIMRRMLEHSRAYGETIYILWISPAVSKYTTLRVEDREILRWNTNADWEYIPNDRFQIPSGVSEVSIRIRKEYKILLE